MSDELAKRLREPGFQTRMMGYDRQAVDELLGDVLAALESGELADPDDAFLHGKLADVGERVEKIIGEARETAALVVKEAKSSAAAMRKQAEERFEQVRGEADAYSHQTRGEADEYAKEVRGEADSYAGQTRSDADEYAAQTRAEADEYAEGAKREADREAGELKSKAAEEIEAASAEAEREIAEARERGDKEAAEIVAEAEAEANELLREARLELRDIEDEIEELAERRELVVASIERMRGSLGSVVGAAAPATEEWAEDVEIEPDELHAGGADEGDAGGEPGTEPEWEDVDSEITVRHMAADAGAVAEHPIVETEEFEQGEEPEEDAAYEGDEDQTEVIDLDTDEQAAR